MPWIMSGIQAAGEHMQKVNRWHQTCRTEKTRIYKSYAHESRWRNHRLSYHLLISFVSKRWELYVFLYGKMSIYTKKGKLLWSGKTHFVPPAPSVQSWLHGALAWNVGSHLRGHNFPSISKHYAEKNTNFAQNLAPWTVCFLHNF